MFCFGDFASLGLFKNCYMHLETSCFTQIVSLYFSVVTPLSRDFGKHGIGSLVPCMDGAFALLVKEKMWSSVTTQKIKYGTIITKGAQGWNVGRYMGTFCDCARKKRWNKLGSYRKKSMWLIRANINLSSIPLNSQIKDTLLE